MSPMASPMASAATTVWLSTAARRVTAAPTRMEVQRVAAARGIAGPVLAWRADDDVQVVAVGDGLRIGRSLSAHVRLEDAHTSRRHARLLGNEAGLTLCEESSANGVWLNGDRVDVQAAVRDGDRVVVGVTELLVVVV